MPNLGNRIPDNPNGILCSASEQKGAKSNPNGILCSAKLPIAGIRQLKRNTMFCERAESAKRQPELHTIFCQRAEKCRQQPNRHNLYSNAMCLCGCTVHIVMIMWI